MQALSQLSYGPTLLPRAGHYGRLLSEREEVFLVLPGQLLVSGLLDMIPGTGTGTA